MLGFGKSTVDKNRIREASIDMTNFLLDKGFSTPEAMAESQKFWSKHYKRLNSVY